MGGGGGSTEKVETLPDWAKPVYQDFLTKSQTLMDSGQLDPVDPLTKEANQELVGTANASKIGAGMLGSSMGEMYKTAMGQDAINTDALKAAATLKSKQDLVGTNQMYGGMGSMASGVGGGRQALDQSDAANRLAAQFAQFDYDAQSDQLARQSDAQKSLGGAFEDWAGGATFGSDLKKEVGKEQSGNLYEQMMKYRDLIDFRTPTQQAAPSGGK